MGASHCRSGDLCLFSCRVAAQTAKVEGDGRSKMSWTARISRLGAAALLVAATVGLAVAPADARVGSKSSIGSRGSKTYTAPPSTNTAPGGGSTINRSITQPSKSTAATQTANAAQQTSRFGGFKGLLLGGLIGAGLASLFGAGAFASVLGFILQTALIIGLVMLVVSFFRNRSAGTQPAMATAGASRSGSGPQQNAYRASSGGGGGSAAGLALGQADFSAFERLLVNIQSSYGQNDVDKLGEMVTPEMLSYFAQELDENARRGVINDVSNVKLLQGDLAESWNEPGVEYATVAMRYSLLDAEIEARTGRVVSGSKDQPQEVTEIWTFRRPTGGRPEQWELSAIQQTG